MIPTTQVEGLGVLDLGVLERGIVASKLERERGIVASKLARAGHRGSQQRAPERSIVAPSSSRPSGA